MRFAFLAFVALAAATAAPAGTRLAPPACSTAVAPSAPLTGVSPAFVKVPGSPFGVVTARDGRAFVSLPGSATSSSIAVLAGGKLRQTTPAGRLATPLGLQLAPGGARIYAADGFGFSVYSTARVERGARTARIAQFGDAGSGAIYVRLSRDGRYAFVADEYSADISVFKLGARRPLVGSIPVADYPVGLALSADGRRLYATSEAGVLTRIDVATAERTPRRAVVRSVAAGCQPVRVVLSPDGATLWVTARGSNAVLAFDEASLALTAVIPVGAAPVGLAFASGSTLVVANSNRFVGSGAQTLSVVDTRKLAVRGTVAAGAFPRELALSADGTLMYVTNFDSGTVELVRTKELAG